VLDLTVAGMCSIAVLMTGALATVGALAQAAAPWQVLILLPWYLVQGLAIVAGALI
jgi:hypothetical protein